MSDLQPREMAIGGWRGCLEHRDRNAHCVS